MTIYKLFPASNTCKLYLHLYQQGPASSNEKKNNSVANKISSSPPTLPDLGPASLAAINTTRSTYPTYSEIEEQTFEDSRKLTTV